MTAPTVSLTTCTIDLAGLGPDSPLPSVQPLLEPPYTVAGGVPEEIAAGARWGKAKNIYPYPLQESYGREVAATELTGVVLENGHVKALFLPQLGGRLWSLTDKASGKELLHTQDRIQFANLALRNAWFAGGIEYNIGTRGHSPTTCAPLHSAIVHTPEGQDVLRMWEFDRLREVVFQIDAWLPADSKVVFVAVRIQNPNRHTVPMYWWTNAAVPQNDATRVIAPAARAYATDYDGSMTVVEPTDFHGFDATWPTRNTHAADFFFDLAPDQRRWEVAADDDGDGLALVSSSRLRGRKLFVWGENVGGHRWQEWLTPTPDGASPRHYAEIQSGLAQTQFEHVPMPAGESWQWVEAYGNASLDPALAGGDWSAAVEHGAARIEALVPEAAVADALADAARWADLAPGEFVVAGNGWGALERARRNAAGLDWVDEAGTPFAGETLTGEQAPWLDLLQGGEAFTGAGSFVRGADWEELLAAPRNAGPEALLHRAVMAHASVDNAADRETVAALYRGALADSVLSGHSRAVALRGLGLVLLASDDVDGGIAHLADACAVEPANRWLITEAMTLAIAHGHPGEALALVSRAPEPLAGVGRVKFLTALAHARKGEPGKAAQMLRDGLEVADLREGENSITALWQEVCPGEDVPERYQFSMH
ncbi:hypothetical protein AL755_05015 [Arthrobacter sp. ERGS1:01]|uniref:DUF5107 domain-containing protein n=1 Tax=Arthrobacter sp. ERGS1:01 TaxID=1704044 RepID=UPI0006CB0668|nr:DUF5107 domain-containing protein [Arthrobacter sp. ERGS1:01]ALE04999.1 hypothetical protein AL755_05015 [Arthrobacter sp. ERGS1:01]